MHLLFETIDAMMYNKLSVFHWHITDEDAFPLILESHPEIAEHGAFSPEETYTSKQARELVRYAMVRGIRVIP
jgi:hexosaminidase